MLGGEDRLAPVLIEIWQALQPTTSLGTGLPGKFAYAVSIRRKAEKKNIRKKFFPVPDSIPKPMVSRQGAPGKGEREPASYFIAFNWHHIGLRLNRWCCVWGKMSLGCLQNNCFWFCLEILNGAHDIFIMQHFSHSYDRNNDRSHSSKGVKPGSSRINPGVFSNY